MKIVQCRPDLENWPADHLNRYLASDGAEGFYVDFTTTGGPPKTPTLILTTIGRRTGQSVQTPLIFGKFEDNYVVIASLGGAPRHPAWYLNLVADPDVEIQIMGEHKRATASTVSGDKREALWNKMVEIYPPYLNYQARTERRIPVVLLAPLRGM